MRELRIELETMPVQRRAAPVLVAAFEPVVLRDVTLALWSGVTVSLGSACSSAVRTVGIGLPLGDLVANFATGALGKLEPIARKCLSVLPAEAAMLRYLGPSLVGTGAMHLAGRTLGCLVAYKLQYLAAVLTVSVTAAKALVGRRPLLPSLTQQLGGARTDRRRALYVGRLTGSRAWRSTSASRRVQRRPPRFGRRCTDATRPPAAPSSSLTARARTPTPPARPRPRAGTGRLGT
jgi:hypothetical protein